MGNNNIRSRSEKSIRISNLTAVTTPQSASIKNKEDVTLIWLDKTIDTSRTALREITNYVRLYTELEPCIEYIRSINTERIFLIVSGSYTEVCLNQIHDLPQVDSIFIFCINLTKYKNQSEQYTKIVGVFDNEEQLIESIRQELNDLHKQLATFSLYKNQKSTRDLLEESASFLWFQLFKDILLQMPRTDQAKNEMIEQCKHFYRGNNEELQLIDEFERTYTKSDTIRWYTKQCFIYRLCNKALRTEDIELLYLFRYYIHDLCKRLANEYQSFKIQQVDQPIIKVYRGLKLTKDEIDKYQLNIGSLISTNGFLSTSRDYNLALQFALKTSKRSTDVLPTLFIIEADLRIDHVVFADISSLSVYPDEQEILFDIGCAFKINEIYFDTETNVWIIKMNLTNEGRQIIETYIEANRREMEKGNIFLIFGLLLTEMGQYDHAQIYFENLLSSNTVDDKPSLYTNIGRVKYLKGLYDEALEDFKIVYDLQREDSSTNDLDLARTMNNLGLVYMEQKIYDLAFKYLFDAIQIYEKNSDVDQLLVASTNNAIGVIFSSKYDYNQALKYLFFAMKLYEKYLPTIDHPLMAMNYNSIGLVYYYLKDYKQSYDYCLKAFHIREKILPIHHQNLGDSCNNLGLIINDYMNINKHWNYFNVR
jgi:tetratricopeptide (TPR) repeat protein